MSDNIVAQLVKLKQKIKSIKITKKISHAIRLVSMAQYGKLEKKNLPLKYHLKNIIQFFMQATNGYEKWQNQILFPNDLLDRNPLFIIIATSKGFCGGLNSNLFRYFDKYFFVDKQQKPLFITIGSRATKFIKEKSIGKIIHSYNELNTNNYENIATDLVNKIVGNQYQQTSITFYSNNLKSIFMQQPKKTILVPLQIDSLYVDNKWLIDTEENGSNPSQNKQSKIDHYDLIWEQDKQKTLNYFTELYLKSIFTSILFQGIFSEHAARFVSMDNSTINADKLLEQLILQYNKNRQDLITMEVSELSASYPCR
jgi:F-type H+-transporting ATPase subunit gamma